MEQPLLTAARRAKFDSVVYVLECERRTWYVGFTRNLEARIHAHFFGSGAVFTFSHLPLRVFEIRPATNECDEYNTWLEYVYRFGYSRVGGYNRHLCRKLGFPWPFEKGTLPKNILSFRLPPGHLPKAQTV